MVGVIEGEFLKSLKVGDIIEVTGSDHSDGRVMVTGHTEHGVTVERLSPASQNRLGSVQTG